MYQLFSDINSLAVSFPHLKYILIFAAVFLEGPLVTVAAAAISTGGALKIQWVFVAAGLGNFTADVCWYLLGYAGRYSGVIQRIPWLRNRESLVLSAEEKMQGNTVQVLAAAKLWFGIAAVPTFIAAGLLKLPWFRVIPVLLLCEILWTGGLVLAGSYGSGCLGRIENLISGIFIFGTVTLLLTVLGVIARKLINQ